MKKLTILIACIFAFVFTCGAAYAMPQKIKDLNLIDGKVSLKDLIQFEIDLDDTDNNKDNDDDFDIDGELTVAKGYSGYYAIVKGNKIKQYLILTVTEETDSNVGVNVEFLDIDDKGNETTDNESLEVVFGKEYNVNINKNLKLGLTAVKRDVDVDNTLDVKLETICAPAKGAEDTETQLHSTHTWVVENKSLVTKQVDVDLELWVDWDDNGLQDIEEDEVEVETEDILIAPLSKINGTKDLYLKVICKKKGDYTFYAETEFDAEDTEGIDFEFKKQGVLVVE